MRPDSLLSSTLSPSCFLDEKHYNICALLYCSDIAHIAYWDFFPRSLFSLLWFCSWLCGFITFSLGCHSALYLIGEALLVRGAEKNKRKGERHMEARHFNLQIAKHTVLKKRVHFVYNTAVVATDSWKRCIVSLGSNAQSRERAGVGCLDVPVAFNSAGAGLGPRAAFHLGKQMVRYNRHHHKMITSPGDSERWSFDNQKGTHSLSNIRAT